MRRSMLRRVRAEPLLRPPVADPAWQLRRDKAWCCPACGVRWPWRVEECPRCEGPCRPMREMST